MTTIVALMQLTSRSLGKLHRRGRIVVTSLFVKHNQGSYTRFFALEMKLEGKEREKNEFD